MELTWACSDSDYGFWRHVEPQHLFFHPRGLHLWTVAVGTTCSAARTTQLAACMGPSEEAVFRAISWRRRRSLSWLPFGSVFALCAVRVGGIAI